MFPILNVWRVRSITKEIVRNHGFRVKAKQILFYMDFGKTLEMKSIKNII